MAEIIPFSGTRYDHARLATPGRLVGPSRDIISEEEKRFFRGLHEKNFCHILHPKPREGGGYAGSRETLRRWRSEGLLLREAGPCLYLYETRFRLETDPAPRVRTGLLALLRLEEYASRVIRPHELTFPAVKEGILRSIEGCGAHLSPIFTFYDDPAQEVTALLRQAAEPRPVCDFTDIEGIGHRLWRVDDPGAVAGAARLLRPRPFYIADGHHRYEACLAYSRAPGASPAAAYTLTYATAMQDPGLTLLPAHRLLKGSHGLSPEEFLDRLRPHFHIEAQPFDTYSDLQLAHIMEGLAARAGRTSVFCLVAHGQRDIYTLALKPEALRRARIHPALRGLDTQVLARVVLGEGLGLGRRERGNEKLFLFEPNYKRAVEKVCRGQAAFGILVNPTRIEQVKAVADAGLYMPRKSSNFFPKVAAGVVLNEMEPQARPPATRPPEPAGRECPR